MTKNDRRSLKDALNSLPEGLNATYDGAMERIKAQSSDDFGLARKVLYWINYALRPLAIKEIQIALAVRPSDHALDEDGILEEERLLSVCAGLVTIQRESQTIILVHHTAQEYFKRQGNKHFPQAQLDMATICLTYLSFDVFEEGPCASYEELEKRLQEYPFLEYAAKYWGKHFTQDPEERVKDLILSFLENDSKVSGSIQIIHETIRQPPGERNQRHKRFKESQHLLYTVHRLWLAAYFGLRDIITVMLEKGVDVLTRTGYGETALHPAARCGQDAVIQLLLGAGADINAINEARDTPLLIATGWGVQPVVVQMLLEKGADVTARDDGGMTALHLAAENGHGAVITLLLEKGADVTAKSNNGWTALHLAAENGHEVIVQLLLKKGADITAKSNDGRTALHQTAQNGHGAVITLLLEKRADVIAKSDDRWTALHLAAENGHEVIVQLLLEKGADITAKNNNRWTALHLAAENGHEVIVWLLLEKGADITAKSNDGRTALH
jgi:ankyrin repeat domain-containing protein 50